MKEFKLYAWCIMYDHVHLMFRPGDRVNYSQIMMSVKSNFSRDANRIIAGEAPKPRLQGRQHSHRDSCTYEVVALDKYMDEFDEAHSIPRFRWQKSFMDHVIRNHRDFDNHMAYIENNHIKHGLPSNWKYTSKKYAKL